MLSDLLHVIENRSQAQEAQVVQLDLNVPLTDQATADSVAAT